MGPTLIPADRAGGWIQADRGARPNQTPFLSGDHNDAYLAAEPADDARFVPVFAHSLEHTGGYTPEAAKQAAAKLLPDILHYDPKRPARFPDNGRAPNDDVSTSSLAFSPTERSPEIKLVRTTIFLLNFLTSAHRIDPRQITGTRGAKSAESGI